VMFCGADDGNVDLTVGPELVTLAELTESSFDGTVGSVHALTDAIARIKAVRSTRSFIV